MQWDMKPGQEGARTAIQARHGGSPSRGISAPARDGSSDNILLWWRPERGSAFGYDDGWARDGSAFYFTGTGQVGDQRFEAPNQENGRLRDHERNGDHIRLLRYVSTNRVCYIGEFKVDARKPWTWRDGPDRYGDVRRMIQFRLLPVDDVILLPEDRVRDEVGRSPRSADLPGMPPSPSPTVIERLGKGWFRQAISARSVLARRRELELIYSFRKWLDTALGLQATGMRIPYSVEARSLRADLFVTVPRVLIEAKASAAREPIRLAIGQLLDYGRWITPPPRLCVLLPAEPPDDMLPLMDSVNIGVAWPTGDEFEVVPTGLLTPL